jgi:transcription initiation factor IIF auxiliary subunit
MDNYKRWKLNHGPKPNLNACTAVNTAASFVPARDNVVELLSRSEKVKLLSDNKKLQETLVSYQQQLKAKKDNGAKSLKTENANLKAALERLRNEKKTLAYQSSVASKPLTVPKSSGLRVSMLSKAFPTEPQTETSDAANLGLINMLMKRSCERPLECSADDISLTRKRLLDDRELAFEDTKRIQSSKERNVEFEHRIQENVNSSDFTREMARKRQLESERQNSHVRNIELNEQMIQLMNLKQRTDMMKFYSSSNASTLQSEGEIDELLAALAKKSSE